MIEEVIVQAGGLGSRMGKYTLNRPKCLITLNGLNVLQTVNIGFPNATLHIIGDYKYYVLKSYLERIELGISYELYRTQEKGTNAGMAEVLSMIPRSKPVAITWSDLYFKCKIEIPNSIDNFIVLSNNNTCRFKYENGRIIEKETKSDGVLGIFIINNREVLGSLPSSGEFVKFLIERNIKLIPIWTDDIIELGTARTLEHYVGNTFNTRFFNQIKIKKNCVIKESRDLIHQQMIRNEAEWYKYMFLHSYKGIPKIFSYDPLRMEKIEGFHPFLPSRSISNNERALIIRSILNELKSIHNIQRVSSDSESVYDVYVLKTLDRIVPVARLLDLENRKKFSVNGRKMVPITPKDKEVFDVIFRRFRNVDYFVPIHGDPTFSNTIIADDGKIKFIDPRGYFGRTKIFGDELYDFAKVYYSAIGNYDQFNIQNYKLKIVGDNITFKIGSSGFESTINIFEEILGDRIKEIKLLQPLIWLSLSGYLANDYDGMIASYFNGLNLLYEMGVEL